jgi:hypothetical protein
VIDLRWNIPGSSRTNQHNSNGGWGTKPHPPFFRYCTYPGAAIVSGACHGPASLGFLGAWQRVGSGGRTLDIPCATFRDQIELLYGWVLPRREYLFSVPNLDHLKSYSHSAKRYSCSYSKKAQAPVLLLVPPDTALRDSVSCSRSSVGTLSYDSIEREAAPSGTRIVGQKETQNTHRRGATRHHNFRLFMAGATPRRADRIGSDVYMETGITPIVRTRCKITTHRHGSALYGSAQVSVPCGNDVCASAQIDLIRQARLIPPDHHNPRYGRGRNAGQMNAQPIQRRVAVIDT